MRKRFGTIGLWLTILLVMLIAAGCTGRAAGNAAGDQSGAVNVYSARHYEVDELLYEKFTADTGIKVNVVAGKAPELIERLQREGANTPADLFITVDGGILNNAKQAGILQPIESKLLQAQVPADFWDRDREWVGLSYRARIIAYVKARVDASEITSYEQLAAPEWKGRVLTRSSTNLYNQSLLASFIAINGEEAATAWAAGVADNLAREPEGGDRDQAKAAVAGAGDVAIMNSYYVGQLSASDNPEDVAVADSLGIVFPNQTTTGTHVNISGAGLVKHSKNKDNAIRLLEFLTGTDAQSIVAQTNFEFPVNEQAELPALLQSWGRFKRQSIDFATLGELNATAVGIFNKVGWK